jgi:hypothetical protein
MCDYNHYTNSEFDVIKTNLIKNEILKAADDGCNFVVGLYLLDGFLQPKARHTEFIEHLKIIKDYSQKLGIKEIFLVSGHGEHIDDCPFPYSFLDYNLRIVYNSYLEVPSLPTFNLENKKFLFLTGMPNRPNRIGLLSKFYDQNMLTYAEWSFFPPWTQEDKHWCRDHLSKYSDLQYEKFLKDCERSFDQRFQTVRDFYGTHTAGETNIVWHDVAHTEWARAPAHIDSDVYKNTMFSVISEGPNFWDDDNNFITEKTWRTFLHRHPFIFAGHPGQFEYIKKLGFRTFEEYMLIKDYAYITDESQRLDAVVKNTEYWLTNIHENLDAIQQDIEHNYKQFFHHIEKQNKLYDYFKKDLAVPTEDIDFYLNGIGYTKIIRSIPDGF